MHARREVRFSKLPRTPWKASGSGATLHSFASAALAASLGAAGSLAGSAPDREDNTGAAGLASEGEADTRRSTSTRLSGRLASVESPRVRRRTLAGLLVDVPETFAFVPEKGRGDG